MVERLMTRREFLKLAITSLAVGAVGYLGLALEKTGWRPEEFVVKDIEKKYGVEVNFDGVKAGDYRGTKLAGVSRMFAALKLENYLNNYSENLVRKVGLERIHAAGECSYDDNNNGNDRTRDWVPGFKGRDYIAFGMGIFEGKRKGFGFIEASGKREDFDALMGSMIYQSFDEEKQKQVAQALRDISKGDDVNFAYENERGMSFLKNGPDVQDDFLSNSDAFANEQAMDNPGADFAETWALAVKWNCLSKKEREAYLDIQTKHRSPRETPTRLEKKIVLVKEVVGKTFPEMKTIIGDKE